MENNKIWNNIAPEQNQSKETDIQNKIGESAVSLSESNTKSSTEALQYDNEKQKEYESIINEARRFFDNEIKQKEAEIEQLPMKLAERDAKEAMKNSILEKISREFQSIVDGEGISPEQVSSIKKIIEKEKEVEPAPEWEVELLYANDSRIVDLRRPLEEQRDYIIAQKGLIEYLENNDTPAKDIALYLEAFKTLEIDESGNKIESINFPSIEEQGRMDGNTENYIEAFKLISDLNREIIRDRLPDASDKFQADFMSSIGGKSSRRGGRRSVLPAQEINKQRENRPQLFTSAADILSETLKPLDHPDVYLRSIYGYYAYTESGLFEEPENPEMILASGGRSCLFTVNYSIYDEDYEDKFIDKRIVCGVIQLSTGEIIPVESQQQAIEALAIQQYIEGRKPHILEEKN